MRFSWLKPFLGKVPSGLWLYKTVRGWKIEYLWHQRCARLRKYGPQILNRVAEIMQAANIRYYADYGTLLGAVREHRFIRHDDDVDFTIPAGTSTAQQIVSAFKEAEDFKFLRAFEWNGWVTEVTFVSQQVEVDFFFNYYENDACYAQWYEPEMVGAEMKWTPRRFKVPPVLEIESRTLYGAALPIPVNYDAVLRASYGDWLTPVDRRKSGMGYRKHVEILNGQAKLVRL